MKKPNSYLNIGTAAFMLLALPSIAHATLDEIIVTAERKATNLQDTPIAVTAMTADEIERSDVSDPISLSLRVPGFSFSPFSAGQAIFSLRGISSNDDGAGTENSVAVFLDDVYFGRVSNGAFNFFDVERIEVLRGPQGTQFGRNAIGGAINITSKKPNLENFESKVNANLGNYERRNLGAYVTGPVADNLAFKISALSRKSDGYIKNIRTGNKINDEDALNLRGQLLWALDDTEITFTASRQDEDNGDMGRIPLKTAAVRGLYDATGATEKNLDAVPAQEGFSKRTNDLYSVKIDHDLAGGANFVSVTAYYETKADWEMDSVGVSQVNVVDEIHDKSEVFTQEFRYSQQLMDDLDVLLGAFYLKEETDRSEWFRRISGTDDRRSPETNDAVGAYRQINETESWAAFIHTDWQITDVWSLNVGIRYTKDEKEIVSSSGGVTNGGFVIEEEFGNITTGTGIRASRSWTNTSPKISLNWEPNDDLMAYLSYSKGYKSGGFGAAPRNEELARNIGVNPEEATNVELGVKTQLLEDTLRLNSAVFQLDYENLQFQRFGPGLLEDPDSPIGGSPDPSSFGYFDTINAGDAEVKGVEFEFTWLATQDLVLSGTYAYLDTDANFNFRQYFTTDPGRDIIVKRPLNRAPKNKYSLNALYAQTLSGGSEIVYNAEYLHSDKKRGDVVDNDVVEDAYSIVNANVSWMNSNGDLEVKLWGRNLTDDRYFSHVYVIGPGEIGVLGEPRVFGISVTKEF